MLDRIKGEFVFICNDCEDDLHTGVDEFSEARQELKDAGWRAYKVGEEWQHQCPTCKPAFARRDPYRED